MPTKQPRPSFALGQKSYDSAIALAKRDGKNLSEWLRDLVEAEIQRQNMPVEPLPQAGAALQEYNAQRRVDAILRNASVYFSEIEMHALEHGVEAWIATATHPAIFVVKFGDGNYYVNSKWGTMASVPSWTTQMIVEFQRSEYFDALNFSEISPAEDIGLYELVPQEWLSKTEPD